MSLGIGSVAAFGMGAASTKPYRRPAASGIISRSSPEAEP
jgi:hypothetical protein